MKTPKELLLSHLFQSLIKIRRVLEHSFTIPFEERIATMLQIQALSYLKEHSNATVGQLATRLNMSSPAIAQLTDRLFNSNLISRNNNKNDRRITHLALTKKGQSQLTKSHKIMEEKMSRVFSSVPEKDLKEVVRIFDNLLKDIQSHE